MARLSSTGEELHGLFSLKNGNFWSTVTCKEYKPTDIDFDFKKRCPELYRECDIKIINKKIYLTIMSNFT